MAPNETVEVTRPPGMLAEVPGVIAKSGRVAGYEHLRDRLLADWEQFIARGVNPYSALKLVIEMDRHAMFADVQAEKKRGHFHEKMWEDFQSYLRGEVDAAPDPVVPVEADESDSYLAKAPASGKEEYDGEDEN